MYTIKDKNYLSLLDTDNKATFDIIVNLLNEYKSDVQKGCHDIRNILALIVGNAGLLELNHKDLENDIRWKQLKEDLNYLNVLMNAINKVRYAHVIHKTEFNYPELLNGIISSYTLSVDTLIEPDVSMINADKSGMEYILRALLDNIYECDKTTRVTIRIYIKNDKIYTSVADNLPAIDDDTRIKLFHLFNTTKQNHSGLSLATASIITMAHDGEISYSFDNGNVFTFYFKR